MSRQFELRFAAAALAVLALSACEHVPFASEARAPEGEAMVSAANPLAVEAGLNVLRRGGSAVDAAVAVQAALGLVEPQSSGIGGGAFMIHYDAETGVVSGYDGRETAPAGATPDMFLGADGAPISFYDAITSGRSVGAPGAIDMLALAHEDHGRLAWGSLFDDAIGLAEDGFEVSPRLHRLIGTYDQFHLGEQEAAQDYFFQDDGAALPVGHLLRNPDYADSLRAIADNPRALLEGRIAEEIVEAISAEPRPGTMTTADLANHHSRRADPICLPYREMSVCSAAPPASGGLAINMILGLVSHHGFSEGGADDPANWHLFIEAQRLTYADRDQYVADPDQVDIPVAGMTNADYLAARAALISSDAAIETAEPGDPWVYEDEAAREAGEDATQEPAGTSHFVIVDAWGDVVSMTTTVESGFGSGRMAGGFLLNNQLTDFSFAPTDESGRPIANAVGAGKRPRSSMSPVIVLDADGEFLFATGSPGGSSIIAYAAKSVIGVLDWGLSPQEAIDLPNVVARGDIVRIESGELRDALVPTLEAMGHEVAEPRGEESGIHSILRMPDGSLEGAADPRREGVARQP